MQKAKVKELIIGFNSIETGSECYILDKKGKLTRVCDIFESGGLILEKNSLPKNKKDKFLKEFLQELKKINEG